jgi:hypothetical protein
MSETVYPAEIMAIADELAAMPLREQLVAIRKFETVYGVTRASQEVRGAIIAAMIRQRERP